MIKRAFFVCICSVAVTGCSTTPHTPLIEEQETIVLQNDLIKECPPLMQLRVKEYSQAESFEVIKTWSLQYKECQYKHKALADVLQNINR